MKLFEKMQLGDLTLSNRIVMAPMTRSRAIDNIPNELMATYYGQRSTAGLIITEGVAPRQTDWDMPESREFIQMNSLKVGSKLPNLFMIKEEKYLYS